MSMSPKFDLVIVGGGILGTIAAALTVQVGFKPLVVRLADAGAPRADTLRNQGWLQSGVMYPAAHFPDLQHYASFALQSYIGGRELLRNCNLPIPTEGGLLKATDPERLDQLKAKLTVLKLSPDEFRQLGSDEAEAAFGMHFDPTASYFKIPDCPFDEAGVLNFFRDKAQQGGAVFLEVAEPVRLANANHAVIVEAGDLRVETPVLVVAAGAGSFDLMHQVAVPLDGDLQRTPLMVADAPKDMPASIVVDLDLGFSAVRHERGADSPAAVVMGTRAKSSKAPRVDAQQRRLSTEELDQFGQGVPPSFYTSFRGGRYTAGYEVIPGAKTGLKLYQPWIVPNKRVIFASPGRATTSLQAGLRLIPEISKAIEEAGGQKTSAVDLSGCTQWECQIQMHYMNNYNYNDAKNEAA